MILETLVTTTHPDGSANIAPMGPWIEPDSDLMRFELRPFQTSSTFGNLQRTRQGVLHITDDVFLFVQAIVGGWSMVPSLLPARHVDGWIIAEACRWVEFEVVWVDTTQPRATLQCRGLHSERRRDFLGFNRAKHAVIEASILASRANFLPADVLRDRFSELQTIVAKTGDRREQEAFELLHHFVQSSHSGPNSVEPWE
ncbi:MAG TPA: DUF447 family protein [Pirellulaceae bacterium]|nr:DUF447 family protein [Pirellulaceae bacterium]